MIRWCLCSLIALCLLGCDSGGAQKRSRPAVSSLEPAAVNTPLTEAQKVRLENFISAFTLAQNLGKSLRGLSTSSESDVNDYESDFYESSQIAQESQINRTNCELKRVDRQVDKRESVASSFVGGAHCPIQSSLERVRQVLTGANSGSIRTMVRHTQKVEFRKSGKWSVLDIRNYSETLKRDENFQFDKSGSDAKLQGRSEVTTSVNTQVHSVDEGSVKIHLVRKIIRRVESGAKDSATDKSEHLLIIEFSDFKLNVDATVNEQESSFEINGVAAEYEQLAKLVPLRFFGKRINKILSKTQSIAGSTSKFCRIRNTSSSWRRRRGLDIKLCVGQDMPQDTVVRSYRGAKVHATLHADSGIKLGLLSGDVLSEKQNSLINADSGTFDFGDGFAFHFYCSEDPKEVSEYCSIPL